MEKDLENNEETEKSMGSVESVQKEEDEVVSPSSSSPETECAICLEPFTNKSFTDSCSHTFCFTCLVDWSKVKPECPFCKQSFSSIVHNVRSSTDYDRYYVNKSTQNEGSHHIQGLEFAATSTPERSHNSNQMELETYFSHRMQFAPHSMQYFSIPPSGLMSPRRIHYIRFRERIYNENLWVSPGIFNQSRCISPQFYRQHISRTHRLLPFLNRELPIVMPNQGVQVSFVIQLIMDLILKYEIRSQEFYTLIETYTAPHTEHFIHEFYNFAVSPYETLESYDQHAQNYIPEAQLKETVSSSDSDVTHIPMDYSNSPHSQSTRNKSSKVEEQNQFKGEHFKGCKKQKKNDVKCTKVIFRSSMLFASSPPKPVSNLGRPSCSNAVEDDDEVEVIDVLKPASERMSETVNISSDHELSDTESEGNSDDTVTLSDDECEILYFKD